MKLVMSLEDSGLLIKGVTQTIENETKKTKEWISWYVIRCITRMLIGKYASY